MADQQDESQEKTEEPTARRLSKAREEGQIARSTEITIAASVISVAIYIYLFGSSLLGNVANIFAQGLVFDSLAVLEPQVAAGRLADAMIEALFSILPILILTGVVVLACSGLIGGYNFSWKSLQPKASKFNPIAGFKRMFGMQALVNLGKSIAKFLLVGGVTYFLIDASITEFAEISLMALEPGLTVSASILTTAFLVASSTLIIIALIDAPYQVYQHNQKMKMSLREVKDERKDTEGSPEVKQRIRQKQREVSAARMLEAIAEADVVITNPEHFAVALAYDPSSEVHRKWWQKARMSWQSAFVREPAKKACRCFSLRFWRGRSFSPRRLRLSFPSRSLRQLLRSLPTYLISTVSIVRATCATSRFHECQTTWCLTLRDGSLKCMTSEP